MVLSITSNHNIPLSDSVHGFCETESKYKILEVDKLANIKSAKKRILVNETKAARNKAIKSNSMDRIWGMISCSYSGKKGEMKRLRAIYKDVYLYYGVTKEDIRCGRRAQGCDC